jgi:hypothetical protein
MTAGTTYQAENGAFLPKGCIFARDAAEKIGSASSRLESGQVFHTLSIRVVYPLELAKPIGLTRYPSPFRRRCAILRRPPVFSNSSTSYAHTKFGRGASAAGSFPDRRCSARVQPCSCMTMTWPPVRSPRAKWSTVKANRTIVIDFASRRPPARTSSHRVTGVVRAGGLFISCRGAQASGQELKEGT